MDALLYLPNWEAVTLKTSQLTKERKKRRQVSYLMAPDKIYFGRILFPEVSFRGVLARQRPMKV